MGSFSKALGKGGGLKKQPYPVPPAGPAMGVGEAEDRPPQLTRLDCLLPHAKTNLQERRELVTLNVDLCVYPHLHKPACVRVRVCVYFMEFL